MRPNANRTCPTSSAERWEGDRAGPRSFALSTYVVDKTMSLLVEMAQAAGSAHRDRHGRPLMEQVVRLLWVKRSINERTIMPLNAPHVIALNNGRAASVSAHSCG